jgi:hypothetical protein
MRAAVGLGQFAECRALLAWSRGSRGRGTRCPYVAYRPGQEAVFIIDIGKYIKIRIGRRTYPKHTNGLSAQAARTISILPSTTSWGTRANLPAMTDPPRVVVVPSGRRITPRSARLRAHGGTSMRSSICFRFATIVNVMMSSFTMCPTFAEYNSHRRRRRLRRCDDAFG